MKAAEPVTQKPAHGNGKGTGRVAGKRRPPPPTFVYFMSCARRIKIGFTADPRIRHLGLSTALPLRVTLLLTMHGTRADERALHERFATARVNGEWFEFSPDFRAFLTEKLNATVAGTAILDGAEREFERWLDTVSP